jgi:hypothetical protein
MSCEHYALDLVVVGVVLCLFAIAGLIYTARNARLSVLGGKLLTACGDDWKSAVIAAGNVALENEALSLAMRRGLNELYGRDRK